jgi:hypothetical protein
MIGLTGFGVCTGAIGRGGATGPAAVARGACSAGCVLAPRGFFRSGLTCRATLSQSARSSSLKVRLAREGAGLSGIEDEGGRFIGFGDNA